MSACKSFDDAVSPLVYVIGLVINGFKMDNYSISVICKYIRQN